MFSQTKMIMVEQKRQLQMIIQLYLSFVCGYNDDDLKSCTKPSALD